MSRPAKDAVTFAPDLKVAAGSDDRIGHMGGPDDIAGAEFVTGAKIVIDRGHSAR